MSNPTTDGPVSYRIVPLADDHIVALVQAHCDCFPGYFLTNLGRKFLETYYRSYLESSGGLGTVALDPAGRVLGFVVGTADGSELESRLYRRHACRVVWTLLTRSLTSRDVRRQLVERIGHLGQGLRVLVGGRRAAAQTKVSDEDAVARLKSIGVRPECRGMGLAEALQTAFEQDMARRGVTRLGLSVLQGNDRAIRFYHKTGWRQIHATERGVWFVKELAPAGDATPDGPPGGR
jgi:ribosomal protein S18 acetylase RimI-like enzyme